MFQYDFVNAREYGTKKDREQSFYTFLNEIGLSRIAYPYSYKPTNQVGYREQVFTVSGWGGYMNADNQWTLFIAYRGLHPKHTIQHCWSWDEASGNCDNYRKMEFIN